MIRYLKVLIQPIAVVDDGENLSEIRGIQPLVLEGRALREAIEEDSNVLAVALEALRVSLEEREKE